VIDAQQIKNFGQEFGIDTIRIAKAQPLLNAAARIKQQKNAGLYLPNEDWHRRNIDEFCDVRSVLPGAKSIIAACQCYLTDEEIHNGASGNPYGLIARYTWRNHYSDLRKRLRKIALVLEKRHGAECMVYSNSGIAEKPIAQQCGIGYYGKHSIIINPTFGSWIVLGEIVNTLEIEPDAPVDAGCRDCTICIEACPTNAIIKPYVIDRRLCIQALTNWYGVLPHEIASVWGNRLYGCTVCQDMWPANRNVTAVRPRTDLGYVGPSISLLEILQIDEAQYRGKYANNQITAKWINFRALQRNAIIALGNIRDPKTLPLLEKLTKDHDTVIAQSARWAVDNF
jgi:epoxyqueuosine reductase